MHENHEDRLKGLEGSAKDYLIAITRIETSAETMNKNVDRIATQVERLVVAIAEARNLATEAKTCAHAAKWWAKMTSGLVALGGIIGGALAVIFR